MTLILASGSASRRRLLEGAGVAFDVVRPDIDEEALKNELRAQEHAPEQQALLLAEGKALSVSRRREGLVIGADQMLALGEQIFDKPRDMEEARAHLMRLRGQTHELLTAAVVTSGETVLWRGLDRPRLTMRVFSAAFLDTYLEQAGERVLTSVGGYQLEGLGAHLFDRVEGDYFSVLGLQVLPLLAFLRTQGITPE